jgi:hypothetical protein
LRDVVLVCGNRQLVRPNGIGVAADALINVGRHVHHVPRGRHERQQRICRLLRPLGCVGRFYQMDIKMQCARVFGIPGDHLFDQPDDLGCSCVGYTVTLPVAPRAQVHHGLDVQDRRVRVLRIALMDPAHRLGVRLIARTPVFGLARIAAGERIDVGPFASACL